MEGKEAGPVAVSQHGSRFRYIAADSPFFFALAFGGIIEEINDKNIICASGLLLFRRVFTLAQVHIARETGRCVSSEAAERFILLNFSDGSALE